MHKNLSLQNTRLFKDFMISRRLIRVKVFKILFSRINSGSDSLTGAVEDLLNSCGKTLDLYFLILSLPLAMRKLVEAKIETGLKKYQPTPEEITPNRRFLENRIIEKLDSDDVLLKYCEKRGLNWNDYTPLVRKLYLSLSAQDYFINYMSAAETTIEDDLKILIRFFEEELDENEELNAILEDLSLYWTDDLEFVINVITKKLESLKSKPKMHHPDVFLKQDDREYAVKLLETALINYNKYIEIMANYIHNWDPERLAATDTSLIILGIAEAITFQDIPVKVTINEYVELSKFYSTPNSKLFVNGILDKIIAGLTAEGKVEKKGRGLVGSLE